jgi:peptidyl-prolyl cis-trans isomerase SurA
MSIRSKFFKQVNATTKLARFALPLSLAASITLLLGLPATLSAEEILLDKIVAVVNDEVVMASELETRTNEIYAQIQAKGTNVPSREAIIPQVLERLILERLQLLKGRQVGIRFSDAEINQTMENMAKQQGMTLNELVEKAHQNGTKLSTIRQQIRDEMIIRRVQEGIINRRVTITDQAIDNFLNSEEGRSSTSPDVHLGHILLPLSAGAAREDIALVQEKISHIYQQLENGNSFESLAIATSSGQNALQGGDLGWRKTAQLPSLFITAIEDLSPGEVSQPIRSDAGYHILKLYERRGASGQKIQQHLARHILLKPTEIRSDEETLKAINELRSRIEAGEDFAALAKEYSEDIGSAMSGGSLGWSVPGQFVSEFENIMNTIELNQVSEPFRSQFGWHILQVTDRRKQDFSDNIKRSQAKNILKQRRFQEELQIWLQEIRDEAYVEIKL